MFFRPPLRFHLQPWFLNQKGSKKLLATACCDWFVCLGGACNRRANRVIWLYETFGFVQKCNRFCDLSELADRRYIKIMIPIFYRHISDVVYFLIHVAGEPHFCRAQLTVTVRPILFHSDTVTHCPLVVPGLLLPTQTIFKETF